MGFLGLLAGCGSRAPAPQVSAPAPPGGFHVVRYPASGVALAAPRAWSTAPAQPPEVALITSGGAVIALWRYPRSGSMSGTAGQLQGALRRLISAARARQPKLRLIGSGTAPVAGHPALELETVQQIGSTAERVSSTHVFSPGEEVVLEEYAPVANFAAVDRSVFSPVRRSLSLSAR